MILQEQKELWVLKIFWSTRCIDLQDPNLLSTLTPDQISALNAIAADDLAPPPSQEDIFGKMDVLKSQFEADNEKIERQFKENQVCEQDKITWMNFYC